MPLPTFRSWSLAVLLATLCITPSRAEPADDQLSFRRSVRPILSTYCFSCHGPDENTREADLRLDTPEGAAVVLTTGDSKDSELIRRIFSEDPDELMPPPSTKRSLTRDQKETLRKWIDQGAQWSGHWAYEPLKNPTLPTPAQATPIENPIDAFVQQLLREKGLKPSDVAARETLIRRLALDLTGLPPTPEAVETFLADDSPDAYERLVDRLLESPAFGERMAWNWLDAARYSDTNGYQGDRERTMWPWRDWVIGAMNRNLSYREFTIWQIAGDLLPDATFEQRLATGFCRNHMINGEGGRIPEENRVDYVMDMTETVGTIWLGLTLNCCRCHDHKFDPITQREYYSLFAFFNQTPVTGAGGNPQTPPILAAPSRDQQRQQSKLQATLGEANARLASRREELRGQQPSWEAKQAANSSSGAWQVAKPTLAAAEQQTLEILDDASVLAAGKNADNDNYLVRLQVSGKFQAIRLEALRHKSMTKNSLSRAESGNFVLTGVNFQLKTDADKRPLKIAGSRATFEQGALKIAASYDGDPKLGWAVYEGRVVDREHTAVFILDSPVDAGEKAELVVGLRHESVHVRHNLGRFRISTSESIDAPFSSEPWRADLRTPADKRTAKQRERIAAAFFAADNKLKQLTTARDRAKKQLDDLTRGFPKVMVMADQSTKRETFLLTRGLYNKRAETVSPDTPASLPAIKPERRDRLALAEWMMDRDNPLTARVTVNRIWQQFFGVGLVKTTEDFGVQGETPEHQQLLDWLAWSFREDGWDVKRLVRLIVTSHTYRQTSRVTPELLEADRENRLLARAPRYRMPSWMIRDQALAASGLLVRRLGGASVNGYQPPGIWEEATFGKKKYSQQRGEALYRRSLYTFWRRIIAPTMFFDNASRQVCTVKPFRTNTPLHALALLNDQAFVEAARALAESVLIDKSLKTDAERAAMVYQRLLIREPRANETPILLAALERSRSAFAQDRDKAVELLKVGDSKANSSLDPVDYAAWTSLCLAVLNLDETLTKQ